MLLRLVILLWNFLSFIIDGDPVQLLGLIITRVIRRLSYICTLPYPRLLINLLEARSLLTY